MNKHFKRATALAMTIVMAASITGCKKDENDKKKNTNTSEYGYEVEYVSLSQGSGNSYIGNCQILGDEIYYVEYTYSEDYSSGTVSLKKSNISKPEDTTTLTELRSTENTSIDISYFFVDQEKNISYLTNTYTFDPSAMEGETGDNGIDLGDIPPEAKITEEYMSQLGIDFSDWDLTFDDISDMTVAEVIRMYQSLNSDDDETGEEEDYGNTEITYVKIDSEGNEIASIDFSEDIKDSYITSSATDSDGNIYLLYSQMIMSKDGEVSDEYESFLKVIDKSGKVTGTYQVDNTIDSISNTGNGTVISLGLPDDGEFCVTPWDADSHEFSSSKSGTFSTGWVEQTFPGNDNDFYYISDGVLYHYDMKELKDEKIMKFNDWNISGDQFPAFSYISEDQMFLISITYDDTASEICLNKITRKKLSEMTQKTEITLGCFYSEDALQQAVINYNKSNPTYKLVLKEYCDDDTSYEDALTNLNKDILSGNGPDIFDIGAMNFKDYSGKGLFEDLYTYIEKDEEFSKKNLNKNILSFFEDDGKLSALPSVYTISGLASSKNLLGDSSLTIDKFAEILKNNPDKEPFESTTRDTLLSHLYSSNQDYFVDFKNKSCNFNDGTFAKVLTISSAYPSDEEYYENYDYDNQPSIAKRVKDGEVLFYQLYIYDVSEYQVASYLFDYNMNITGYPSAGDNKLSATVSSGLYAINSNSKYKDECWEFIKAAFNSSMNNYFNSGFPVDNDVLDEMLKKYSTVQTDEDGNPIDGISSYDFGDITIDLSYLTEAQVEELKSLVNSIDTLESQDDVSGIYDIITEEAEAFYNGKKSADEVCDVIQSRVNILINEGE